MPVSGYYWFGGGPGLHSSDCYLVDAQGVRVEGAAATVKDAVTGAVLTDLLNLSGAAVTSIVSGTLGYLTFAARVPVVDVVSGSETFRFSSSTAVEDVVNAAPSMTALAASAASAQASATASAAAAAATAAGAGGTNASLLTSGTVADARLPTAAQVATLNSTYVGVPDVLERVQYVTPRGSDANSGLTLKTAKLTIAAALAGLGGNPGTVRLGVGTITTAATHVLPNGTTIAGVARGMSTISYTGTGALFTAVSGTRTYNIRIESLTMIGSGAGSGTTGVDLVDATNARVSDSDINAFGTGIKNRSTILGGAVYNRVYDCVMNSCGIGVHLTPIGSNSIRIRDSKFGACATAAVSILDSNENVISGCEFEGNTAGVKIDASISGASDHNSISECRFEGNTTDVNIASANVRDAAILLPKLFTGWALTDAGTRTRCLIASIAAPPIGTQRYLNVRSGPYTPITGDDVVFVNAPTETLSLPSAVTSKEGRVFVVKNLHATALTVNSPTAGTIDGAASAPLAQYAVGRYISDGTNWFGI